MNLSKLCIFTFGLCAILAHDDILLTMNFGSLNFRIVQLVISLLDLLIVIYLWNKSSGKYSNIGKFVIALTILLVITNWISTLTNFSMRGVAIAAFFTFNAVTALLIGLFLHSTRLHEKFVDLFIIGGFFAAILGILQFLAGVVVGFDLGVTQWWIPGCLPRINGLSYEPSYYGTYLLTVFVLWNERRLINNEIYRTGYGVISMAPNFLSHLNMLMCITISVALILSSSRLAIGAFLLYLLFRNGPVFFAAMIAMPALIGLGMVLFGEDVLPVLLTGTGIGGASDYSTMTRFDQMMSTIEIWQLHPLLGVGLGNVGPEIARQNGLDWAMVFETEGWKIEPLNITFEAAAGIGMVGLLYFICIPGLAIWTWVKARGSSSGDVRVSVAASLFVLILLLNFNQGLNRVYMWLLFGIFLGAILHSRDSAVPGGHYSPISLKL